MSAGERERERHTRSASRSLDLSISDLGDDLGRGASGKSYENECGTHLELSPFLFFLLLITPLWLFFRRSQDMKNECVGES